MRPFLAMALCVAALSAAAAPLTLTRPEPVDLARIVFADDNGRQRPLADILPPKRVIVHFWATWCAPCRDELPAVARFAAALSDEGLGDRLLVVSVDRHAHDRVAAFLHEELGLHGLDAWQDISRTAGPTFRLFGYPSTLLLDARRRVVGRHPGPLDWDGADIRAALRAHLASAD